MKPFVTAFCLVFFAFALIGPVAHCLPDGQPGLDYEVQRLLDEGWAFFVQMHRGLENLDFAIDAYKKALDLDPENEDAHWKLAEATLKKGEASTNDSKRQELFTESLAWAQKAVDINPNSAPGHYWMGASRILLAQMAGLFRAAGLARQAQADLRKTIDLAPQNRFAVLAKVVLAAIKAQAPWPMGNLGEAQKLAIEAVSQDPNLTLASVTLGEILIAQGQYEKARQEFIRCLNTENPTYPWDSILYDWPKARRGLEQVMVMP
ncbi:MAG: tetratricopeptide repeat protein [Desulfatibacillaceae bacterium]|nr:tetratricopeptide repeat protein [Desulfatibacillaceae bacterium]